MMEFLNNIWIAISTQNEQLVNLVSIPLMFIEVSLILYLIISIFNLQTTKKQNFIYISITLFFGVISMYFLGNPLNVILNFISLFFTIHFILKIDFLKTIVATVFPSILFSILESLLFNPYITLLNITAEQVLSTVIYKVPINT